MTGGASMFINLNHKDRGHVTYGDNIQGNILRECIMGNPSTINIEGVLLVKRLKQNLLSVGQLYDKGIILFSIP